MEKKILIILLILSVIGNIIGLFVLYKALHYRSVVLEQNKSVQDLGNLAEYADENRTLNSKPEVVFYGASITRLMDLEKLFPGKNYVSRGVNGQYAQQLLLRFKQDVIDLQPGGVVIKLCSINMAGFIPLETTKYYLKTMVEMAEAAGIKVYLATVVPVGKAYADEYKDRNVVEKIRDLNQWIRGYADGKGIPVIDYFRALANEKGMLNDDITRDGLHPNEDAFLIMGETALAVLDRDTGDQEAMDITPEDSGTF
jgi:lysophospholipase L1-like esterase